MFERNKSYNLPKPEKSKTETVNSFINPAFVRSDDEKVEYKKGRLSLGFIERNVAKKRKSIVEEEKEVEEHILNIRRSIVPELCTVLKWSNVEVTVKQKSMSKKILHGVSGEINNLEIMAILGPSGAGKSTLLNTIAGKIQCTGKVKFYSKTKNLSFAYVPQYDELSPLLTMEESLLFASRLKNPHYTDHKEEVKFILGSFNLYRCKNFLVRNCSGGERKRLSIGLELISKPKILILDEPTSGLDSHTSYKVIDTLKNSTKDTIVIASIHQPNSNLFQLFDKCYVLTSGYCIYNGQPNQIVDYFHNFSVDCPMFTNPADFILDVANDASPEGTTLIKKLSKIQQENSSKLTVDEQKLNDVYLKTSKNNNNNSSFFKSSSTSNFESSTFIDPLSNKPVHLQELKRSNLKKKNNFMREYFLILKKLLLCTIRDPQQTYFRLLNNLAFPVFLYFIVSFHHGNETGCSFNLKNETHVLYENTYERLDRQLIGTQNVGLTFVNLMFSFFTSLVPAVLVLSNHINVLKKEHMNSYYSISSFYFAILTMNILLCIIFSTLNSFFYFFLTKQTYYFEKFFFFWLINLTAALIGDLLGFSFSILYPKDSLTAVVISSFLGFSLHSVSGFFVPSNKMTYYVEKFSNLVFCRHIFEAAIKSFYSKTRCIIPSNYIFTYDQIIDMVEYYNHETNSSLSIVQETPLKVRTSLQEKDWTKSDIFELAEALNNLNETGLESLDTFWTNSNCYITNNLNLNNTSLESNLIAIFINIFLFIIYTFTLTNFKILKYK